jgi:geranylgeranyl pyrophosphate synthase
VLGRLIRGPGKRLRPAFVYWGYRAAGGAATGPDADAALRVGCAVEFLHACALICDDLMDGSPIRHWEPAGLRPDRLAVVLRLSTTLRTEVIGGQYLDLVGAQRGTAPAGDQPPAAEQISAAERILRYKSAK